MAGTLGTITGQIRIDVKQAIAAYAAVRAANISTLLALRSASTVFLAAGAAMGGAGLLIVAGFVKGIKAAADFERQLDFFGAVSNSTAKEMEAVRAKAIQLGQDTIYSTGQIADSFVALGKAGVSAEDIIKGVGDAVAHLGAAGDIPLEQAANIITAAIQTFKLGAQDATHVADLLAGAANSSVVDIDDLGVSLKYVGGVAAAISIPIDDVVDALALLGKAGIRGSTAGTSLRQILVSLTGTSKKAEKQLKSLGIITADGTNQFFTAQGKAKSLSEIFQILQEHTKGLTEAQRLAAFKTIFNNRALAAANILSREGAKGFALMNKEVSKTTAADVAAKRLDNLSGDVEKLKSSLEVLFLQAGAPFQEFLRGVTQNITKLVNAFTSLSPATQDTIFKITAIGGALLLLMGTISTVIGLILRFSANMLLMRDAIKLIIATVQAYRNAVIGAWLATLGPVGIIILVLLLLAAVFVILWKKSETFRNIVKAVGRAIVTAFWAVVNFFRGPFVDAMVSAWNAVVGGFNAGKDAIVNAFWAVVNFFRGPFVGFFVSIWNTVVNAFVTAKNAVVAAWNAVGAFFASVGSAILNGIISAFNAVVGFFAALPGRILGFVTALVTGIINFFRQLPEAIAYQIGFMIGTAIRLWINFQTLLLQVVSTIINSVISFFQQLPGRLAAIWLAIVNASITAWLALKNAIVNAAIATYNGVISFFSQLPGRVAGFFVSVYNAAVSKFNALKTAVVNAARAAYSGIVSFFSQLPGKVASFFASTYTAAVNKFNSMKASLINLAKSAVSGISSALSTLIAKIGTIFANATIAGIKKMTDLKNKVVSIAKALPGAVASALTGLGAAIRGAFEAAINAVSGLGGAAYDKAKSIGSSLWKGFKDGMGIHSPSFIEKAMFSVHDTMVQEIGFLGGMVRKAQKIGGGMPTVARSIAGVNAAREASLANLVGPMAGTGDVITSNASNQDIVEAVERLIEEVHNSDKNVYLDGKKVDAVMSNAALAGGYGNERR